MLTLGGEVRNWREYRGLGVRELARAADIDPGYVTRIEADEKVPSPEVIGRLTKALGIKIHDYFYEQVARALLEQWKLRTGHSNQQENDSE